MCLHYLLCFQCSHACIALEQQPVTFCATFLSAFLDPNPGQIGSPELCLDTNSFPLEMRGCCPACIGKNSLGLSFDQEQYNDRVQFVKARVEEQFALYESRKAAEVQ